MNLLYQEGVHICVDGPSGTGKTSLVRTQLHKYREECGKRAIRLQLTKNVDWPQACKQILKKIAVGDDNSALEEAVSPKPKSRGRARANKGSEALSQYDICEEIERSRSILYIDDFEKANEQLVVMFSDICKLMTQEFEGKVIIVGTGAIYSKIMEVEPALENRLFPMSVGALPNADDGWKFLCLGFDKLGIAHPARLYDHKTVSGKAYEGLRACKVAIHDAVASLPKALNDFGRNVSLTCAEATRRLSFEDLSRAAKDAFLRKVDEYSRYIPKYYSLTEKPELRIVLGSVYRRKIGTILRTEDIFNEVKKEGLNRDQFEDALLDLVHEEILTRTGRNGETLFVANLYLAHIFGVCAEKYAQYDLDPSVYGKHGQLSFPFGSPLS